MNSLYDNIRELLNDLEHIRNVVRTMTDRTWRVDRIALSVMLDTMLEEPSPEEIAKDKAELQRLMKKRV
jgi:hypothetical protein